LPCDIIGTIHHSDDVTTPEIEVRDGELMIPKGPGLGLTFDPAKAEKYSITG